MTIYGSQHLPPESRNRGTRSGPGHLEASNVNVVSEMVTLIAVQRAYEANQRVIQAHDQALERAVNDIGAV